MMDDREQWRISGTVSSASSERELGGGDDNQNRRQTIK